MGAAHDVHTRISSIFPAPASKVWSLVKKSSTLVYIARGMLGFSGSSRFPAEFREGETVSTRLLFFGLLPAWRHRIEVQRVDETDLALRSREGGGPVRTWNHVITVEPTGDRSCRYTDDVEIRAGVLTPLVWLFAQVFYRYRQMRWRSLLKFS